MFFALREPLSVLSLVRSQSLLELANLLFLSFEQDCVLPKIENQYQIRITETLRLTREALRLD
jgi:hypothetical protein